jgi:Zn-dependent metalloprotease
VGFHAIFLFQLYADPTTGERVAEVPLILMAENRTVYNANNGKTLPGSLARTENGSASQDNTVNQAFDNAGNCYDFYLNKLGRDSWDGKGGDMISTVHYDKNYNNAFWNGEQMVYGDGDGVNFIDFAGDLSVVCHELTHAVVQATAALRYLGESGALNEGWADAMGVSAVRYVNGGETATRWWIGPNCTLFAPALRFMQNPVMDNSSRDWYPDRYRGIADNGGVHWNSGIPNLAFVLFTEGGVHPQFKSSIYVNGVGWDNSEIVWYNALFYMTSTSNMAAAAAATETAALCNTQITNNHEIATAASTAWQAVGVLNASADRGLSAAC